MSWGVGYCRSCRVVGITKDRKDRKDEARQPDKPASRIPGQAGQVQESLGGWS
jgi:hypothetical protein